MRWLAGVVCLVAATHTHGVEARPTWLVDFLEANCLDCHSGDAPEGGLNLETQRFQLDQPNVFQTWVSVYDRVRDGEMPPSDAAGLETGPFLKELGGRLIRADRQRIAQSGRAAVRRLNRREYENKLRSVLNAPWLHVAGMLPEDGVAHLFNKVGSRLDISHVQVARYLEVAEDALQRATNAAAWPSETRKFYAREEPVMQHYLHYRFGQRAATRAIVPLLGWTPEVEIIRKNQPVTVGASDPETREREAMGVFSGTYNATTKYDFTRIDAPTDGRYRLRFKTYTFMAGPNGASGGSDHGLTGGRRKWWRPDRNVAFRGQRSEPVTLYALASSGDSRWLTTFDSHAEPSVFECEVVLREGEGIRPDAARLVRTRPGWKGNPNATRDGVPGFAMNWLEVEGPLSDQWPPASYRAVFGDMPFEVTTDSKVKVISSDPQRDAQRRLLAIVQRANPQLIVSPESVAPFVEIFQTARQMGQEFTSAFISATAAYFSSPQFLFFDHPPGPLSRAALQERLAYFLWNGPPDNFEAGDEQDAPCVERSVSRPTLRHWVNQMLQDRRHERFVTSFLDYWLDLRDINANTPDATLYPDYYLDELLTESSLLETQAFFKALIQDDLPARNLVDSSFVMVNERLAKHYGLSGVEGVKIRRVTLPPNSVRGGLLTHASVLRVTANGTTTSPVVRGAWVMERLMGLPIPAPPSGVAAVEPDTRGATTIREQLEKHRAHTSCNSCHAQFDPAGLALESFDVTGKHRQRYRALGTIGQDVEGFGKNGHAFQFKLAQPVNCSGTMADGRTFDDVRDLKRLLLADERQIARNLLNRLIVYATGAAVTFSDRREMEAILDRTKANQYGVRSLIQELVDSRVFRTK